MKPNLRLFSSWSQFAHRAPALKPASTAQSLDTSQAPPRRHPLQHRSLLRVLARAAGIAALLPAAGLHQARAIDVDTNTISGKVCWTNSPTANPQPILYPGMNVSKHLQLSYNNWTGSFHGGFGDYTVRAANDPNNGHTTSTPLLNSSTPHSGLYSISPFADADGENYALVATARLWPSQNYYFAGLSATAVFPHPPAPNITGKDICECAGLIHIRYRDQNGLPAIPLSSGIYADIPSFGRQASGACGTLNGVPLSDYYLLVRGDMYKPYNVTISLSQRFGSGGEFGNQYDTGENFEFPGVVVDCEDIVPLPSPIIVVGDGPPTLPLGQICGRVDMLDAGSTGIYEHWVSGRTTVMRASEGAWGNKRSTELVPTTNNGSGVPYVGTSNSSSSGDFCLSSLLLSNASGIESNWQIRGGMTFWEGDAYETFQLPYLSNANPDHRLPADPLFPPNGRIHLASTTPVALGDTFVVDPGIRRGTIDLCGPEDTLDALSPLRYIKRDSDILYSTAIPLPADGVGGTVKTHLGLSNVRAAGVGHQAAWMDINSVNHVAKHTAAGGEARACFQGAFDAGDDHFHGAYKMALGGLNKEPSIWNHGNFNLVIKNTDVANAGANHYASEVSVWNREYTNSQGTWNFEDQTIMPQSGINPNDPINARYNHHYGMSVVRIKFHSNNPDVNFYGPYVSTDGVNSSPAVDFEGSAVSYSPWFRATGTPLDEATAAADAYVNIAAVAGTYTNIAASVGGRNVNGSTNSIPINKFNLTIGACQRACVTPTLQMTLVAPECVTNPLGPVHITGSVTSFDEADHDDNVTSITYVLNDSVTGAVQNPGGLTPSFSFNLPIGTASGLHDCLNKLKVTAMTADGEEACVETYIMVDYTAPVLHGCQDVITSTAKGSPGKVVNYVVTATDNCPGAVDVVCLPPSGSLFPCGTTVVHCTATDHCGNTSECSFNVTVVCDCMLVANGKLECSPVAGVMGYSFDVTNYTGLPVKYVLLVPKDNCFEFVPDSIQIIDLGTPLAHGQTKHVSTQVRITGPCPDGLCFYLSIHSPTFALCCSQEVCVPFGPPVITGCQDIEVPCENEDGALVMYPMPTATGSMSHAPTVTCVPPPGNFPIGITPVTCTATDCLGQTTTCSFTIIVTAHGLPEWKWARKGGGSWPAGGNAVAVDRWGNVYITGIFKETIVLPSPGLTLTLNAAGGAEDWFVAKYTSSGDLRWAVAGGGAGRDAGYGIAVDDAGNVYVTGEYNSTVPIDLGLGVTLPGSLGADVFVANYDTNGIARWAQRTGGTGNDRGRGIAVQGGKVFVTGSITTPTEQAFVWELTDAGASVAQVTSFATTGHSAQVAWGRGIAVDSAGKVYVAGGYRQATSFTGTAAPLPVPVSGYQMFVAKFDSTSVLLPCLWTTHAQKPGVPTASGNSDATGIALDAAGTRLSVCGYYNGTANFGFSPTTSSTITVTDPKHSPNGQLNDLFVAQLATTNAAPFWARRGSGAASGGLDSDDEANGIAVDAEGNACITGFLHPFAPFTGTPFVNDGPTVLVASYDTTGQLRWTNHAQDVPAGAPRDVGRGIAIDRAGCIHVTGAFTETLAFPPAGSLTQLAVTAVPDVNLFVAKMCPDCCTPGANLITNGSFETTVPAIGVGTYNNALHPTTGVPGWTSTVAIGNNFLEVWSNPFVANWPASDGRNQLEINAQSSDETVSQTITGLDMTCPATLCFDYSGRYGLVPGSTPVETPNNDFTVTLTPGSGTPITIPLDPVAFTPAGGWLTSCTTFWPTSTSYTIAFHGKPHSVVAGGAHIDNVRLTQDCCHDHPGGGGIIDIDGDGMSDLWELAHGLNPNSAADATQDKDGDGVSNLQEYHDGTDPNDAHSVLILVPGGLMNGGTGIKLTFDGVVGHSYTIEHSSSPGGPWSTVATVPVQSVSGPVEVNVPTGGAARCFFRIHTP